MSDARHAGQGRGTQEALAAVTMRHVSKTFPGQKALDDVSFDIEPGTIHAVVGENGSGKSTLIKILAGYYVPDPGGNITVAGTELEVGSTSASFRAGLRFVHQHLSVVGQMNAVENVALAAGFTRPARIDWGGQASLTEQLLEPLGIRMDIWRPLDECTLLERRAVEIARALRPVDTSTDSSASALRLIVLDEPTASMPERDVRRLIDLVREISRQGISVLYVSHRLQEVLMLARTVSVLRDGRLRATEPVSGMTTRELVSLIIGPKAETRDRISASHVPVRLSAPRLTVRRLSSGDIEDLSFDIFQGEVVGIFGVEGSGREHAARAIIGASALKTGAIAVDGKPLRSMSPRDAVRAGLVLAQSNTQAHGAVRSFSARENITLGHLEDFTTRFRINRRREAAAVRDWMHLLDVRPPDPERRYQLLSGGNQQKVILAKWLSARPKVLVLDEPTAGVDVGTRVAVYDIIRSHAEDSGVAVVLCSSDAEDIVNACSRALVMRAGRIHCDLGREDLTEHRLLYEALGGELVSAKTAREAAGLLAREGKRS